MHYGMNNATIKKEKEALMKSKLSVLVILGLIVPILLTASVQAYSYSILSVVQDQSVTIQTYGFPANDTFNVTMGYNGTWGIGGTLVSKLTTGSGGTIKAKFYIPPELYGQNIIAIRLESPTSGKWYANWFYNNTATVPVYPYAAPTSTPKPGGGIPEGSTHFLIKSVVKGESVTVTLVNFPSNHNYAVFMGKTSTKTPVYPWYEVAGFNSADGHSFNATFSIPPELEFFPQITIKIWDMAWPHNFTYNWFYNYTTS